MVLLGIDQGGTHTDCVVLEDGTLRTAKVPTETNRVESTLSGIEQFDTDPAQIEVFNHGTTEGINSILERDVPKVGFLTTEGHRDTLDMGRCWRPFEALMDPHWRRSFGDSREPLVPRYLRRGVRERIDRSGDVVVPLDENQLREQLDVFERCDVEGVGVCLLNAFVDDGHERRIEEIVREEYEFPVSVSSQVSNHAKEYPRASTTVISNVLKLIIPTYCDDIYRSLSDAGFSGQFNMIESSGRVIPHSLVSKKPHEVMYSGPAAGTISGAYFGEALGVENLLCIDMGGTSCDVSVVEGGQPGVETSFEIEHDLVVNTLAVEISTAGAGGGSIVHLDEMGDLHVGPESAGAVPGPVCYDRGGEQPTITDVYLLNNVLDAGAFLGGDISLNRDRAEAAIEALDLEMDLDAKLEYSRQVGLENVLGGIEQVTLERALDPRNYSMLAYGAAGPMILPELLDDIGVREVIVPPSPGEFSAMGLLCTDLIYSDSRSDYLALDAETAGHIEAIYRDLEAEVLASIDETPEDESVVVERFFDGRLAGQTWDTPLVPVPSGTLNDAAVERMTADFHDVYEQNWGSRFEALPVVATTYRVRVTKAAPKITYETIESGSGRPAVTATTTVNRGEPIEYDEYTRDALKAGHVVDGPAIVRQPTSTIQICAGQRATVGEYGELTIRSE